MGFSTISLGSVVGRNPKVFRWELLRAHPFAPCGVDNVSLTFCYLQARRLSGAGIHPSILFLENRLVSLEPEPLGSVCLGGQYEGNDPEVFLLQVRAGRHRGDRTE